MNKDIDSKWAMQPLEFPTKKIIIERIITGTATFWTMRKKLTTKKRFKLKNKAIFFLDSFQVWGEPNTVYVDAHRASFKVVMYS